MRIMNSKTVVKSKAALIKYQIYLNDELQKRLSSYLENTYGKGEKVFTATFRKAISEFLDKRGY